MDNTSDNSLKEKEQEIRDLKSQLDELRGMLQGFMGASANQPTIIDTTSKMDVPCTLIHMIECMDGLPTVIEVNGNIHHFTRFGEQRTFRLQEMQNIASKYRSFFERGIFTLGTDCDDKLDELGLKKFRNPILPEIYHKIETLPNEDFESLIKKISDVQRVQLAKTWVQRYSNNQDGYQDVDKIRILNKYTKDKVIFKNGLLANLLKDMIDETEE